MVNKACHVLGLSGHSIVLFPFKLLREMNINNYCGMLLKNDCLLILNRYVYFYK